ncbi:MAG: CotH kinase family protein [bacterium]
MKTKSITFLYLILFFISCSVYSQSILINEVQSTNVNTIFDEDNESSDWIELYNYGDDDINLNGFSLSDDINNLSKWIFPNISIKANSYLLIFASDKNRINYIGSWQTIIKKGDNWKYKIFNSEPPVSWKNLGYNDSLWDEGASGFGFGDDDDSTIVPNTISLYLRKTFNIQDTAGIADAFLHIDFDDGFVAYLNGVELTRQNLGNNGEFIAYNRGADNSSEANMYSGGLPYAFQLNELTDLLVPGENVLTIQVHNHDTNSSDLTLIPFFTLGYNHTFQDTTYLDPSLILTLPKLHTNFKISSDGEELYLTNTNKQILDSFIIPPLSSDISFGRNPDSLSTLLYYNYPTPERRNLNFGYLGFTSTPHINFEGGFYNNSISIIITNQNIIEQVYYTFDGSIPDTNSLIYTSPLNVQETSVLRFRGFSSGMLPSEVITNTYLINENISMPVVSISTDPENLWDNQTGIYVLGDNYEPEFPFFGANFWQDWEKPAFFEIFETDKVSNYKSNAGIKIHGNWSRALAEKSLALFARSEYGNKEFEYELFPNRNFTKYNNFILRNSGQDWNNTMFRDLLMQNIVEDLNLDLQAGRPAIVFLNGKYWGIHNIREKLNEDFLASHNNLLPDKLNILENNGNIVQGTNEKYLDLITFITNNSLANNTNYSFVKTQINIDNYIDYELSQIYYSNDDWPGNNIKFWNSQNDTSRWCWLIFDTDFGFGLFNNNAVSFNTLNFALDANGPNWPNPPWSTLLLRKLTENQEFKYNFINRFADLANSVFKKEIVLSKIDSLKNIYNTEINRHIEKWGAFSYSKWLSNVNFLKSFATSRTAYLTLYFLQKFGIQTTGIIKLNVNDLNMGQIKINRLKVNLFPWIGVYFKNIPVQVTAIPKAGYKFVRWSGISNSQNEVISIIPTGIDSLKAIFQPDSAYGTIVINEINYNSSSSFDTDDWVEFFNSSKNTIDISGWIFKDEDDTHSFIFPDGTYILANNYLVICKDTLLVKDHFAGIQNIIGNMSFGLSSSGELVRLYDANFRIIDSLTFDDNAPWPTAPDGNGTSLSLINPNLDNSLATSWKASLGHGTPGSVNDIFTLINEPIEFFSYSLSQNYPNPFNPSTKIQFFIPNGSFVKIEIFNILGEKVFTLCDEYLNKGLYIKEFDGSNLASGIYIYQFAAENFIKVKKMLLIK